jgi:hypothetical protein
MPKISGRRSITNKITPSSIAITHLLHLKLTNQSCFAEESIKGGEKDAKT